MAIYGTLLESTSKFDEITILENSLTRELDQFESLVKGSSLVFSESGSSIEYLKEGVLQTIGNKIKELWDKFKAWVKKIFTAIKDKISRAIKWLKGEKTDDKDSKSSDNKSGSSNDNDTNVNKNSTSTTNTSSSGSSGSGDSDSKNNDSRSYNNISGSDRMALGKKETYREYIFHVNSSAIPNLKKLYEYEENSANIVKDFLDGIGNNRTELGLYNSEKMKDFCAKFKDKLYDVNGDQNRSFDLLNRLIQREFVEFPEYDKTKINQFKNTLRGYNTDLNKVIVDLNTVAKKLESGCIAKMESNKNTILKQLNYPSYENCIDDVTSVFKREISSFKATVMRLHKLSNHALESITRNTKFMNRLNKAFA